MGKHVPNGNLFPTVRTRRPTEQRVHLSTERVCLPTSLQIYNRMRISADRSIERRPTVRLHRTLAPYCYLNSPFWWILSYVCCEERNRLILRLCCALAAKNDPDWYWVVRAARNEITRTINASITLPPTIDRAVTPTIYKLTTVAPIRLLLRPDYNYADTPTVLPTV